MFKHASTPQIKIRLAFSGPAGSGKTFSALAIASHLSQKIAVIDTQRGSASFYANLFTFDICELAEHHPVKYIEAIIAAEADGYEVIIIDSLSHAWYAQLEMLHTNKWGPTNFDWWKNIRPWERKLLDTIIGSPSHIIATMRTETEWDITQKDTDGKIKPVRIGTAPIQTTEINYEFDISGEITSDHIFYISKSLYSDLQDTSWLKPGAELAKMLKKWIGTSQLDNDRTNYRIEQIRNLLGIDSNLVQQWFKTKKFAETSADLSMEQVNQLLLWMAIQWATKQGILKIDHATNSFLKYVTNLTSNDFEELEAIKQWMQHLQGKSFKTIKA